MITDDVIDAFIKCKYKAFLKYNDKYGSKTDFEILERELLTAYKSKFYENLYSKISEDLILWKVTINGNQEFKEANYALDAALKLNDFAIRFDAIEIFPEKSLPKHISCTPISIFPKEKISKLDKLSFAAKCKILNQLSGIHIEFARIIYGHNLKSTRINLQNYTKEINNILRELKKTVYSEDAPHLYQINHCKFCEFHMQCRNNLIEKDDLSLLGGIGNNETQKINLRGIFTIHQYSYTFKPRRRKKVSKIPQRFEYALKALALRENQTYIQEIPKLPDRNVEIYMDFEGLPDENFIYLIGLLIKEGETVKQYSFWADSKQGEERIFQQLFELLSSFKNFAIYHYGSYEIRSLNRVNKELNNVFEQNINFIIEKFVNILSFFSSTIYPPTYTNGLKDIAGFLDFKWSDKNASGIQSIVWRKRWELSGDPGYKSKVLQYNIDDCFALRITKEWIANIKRNIENDEKVNLAKVDDIKIENVKDFGTPEYQTPDFAKIGKYAYFDYQRSKIYLRTNKNIKKAIKKKEKADKFVNRIDKTIKICPKECTNCGHIQFDELKKFEKIVIDLKFIKNGIKRWVVKYIGGKFICLNCKTKITPKNFKGIPKYEHNLVAWSINQYISYRVGLNKVSKILLESFNIYIPEVYMYQFKENLSNKYFNTFIEIKKKILSGALVHIDETAVKIRNFSSGYVWVFTNMDSVLYLFRPNREADFLKDLLEGFKGVLISDFYAGYDSIPCPQQKCLIHLIRDLNNDLLKNQLNFEYKNIVIIFGEMLRKIIDTVDKYGLKKRHLNKHKKHAN